MANTSLLNQLRNRARTEKGLPSDEPEEPAESVGTAVLEPEDEPDGEPEPEYEPEIDEPEPEIDHGFVDNDEHEGVHTDHGDFTGYGSATRQVAEAVSDVVSDPRFRTATADLVEARVSALLYDVAPDNRLVLKVVGATLTVLKAQWVLYNQSRSPSSRIPFSAYVARRLDYCREHNSESKSLYLSADDIATLDVLAGDNFQTAEQLVNWIRRVVTPVSTIEGVTSGPSEIRFHPISADIFDRYASGCYPGESPVDRMSEDIDDFLRRKVGL